MVDSSFAVFVLLNLVLVAIVVRFVIRIYKTEAKAFLNLSVICILHVFIGGFVGPNFRYLIEDDWFDFRHLIPNGELYYWLNIAMISSIFGAVGLSLGYSINLGARVGLEFRKLILTSSWIVKESLPSILFANSLLSAGSMLQLYLLSTGSLGYFARTDSIQMTGNVSQILSVVTSGGMLGLLMLSLRAFGSEDNAWLTRPILWFWVAIGVCIGIATGFKTQVFFPIATVAVGYYASRNRFPFLYCLLLSVFVFFSFIVIEPLRKLKNQNLLTSSDVGEILAATSQILSESLDGGGAGSNFTIYRLLGRLDLANITAVVMHFASDENVSMEGAPDFGKGILMAPINAVIPRAIWEGKALVNEGRWFSYHVLGLSRTIETSIGMGPVSYFYFLGGWPAVFIGFGVIGFSHRVLHTTFGDLGIPGTILLLCMIPSVALLESNIGAILTTAIRNLAFLFVVCKFFMFDPKDHFPAKNSLLTRPV